MKPCRLRGRLLKRFEAAHVHGTRISATSGSRFSTNGYGLGVLGDGARTNQCEF